MEIVIEYFVAQTHNCFCLGVVGLAWISVVVVCHPVTVRLANLKS